MDVGTIEAILRLRDEMTARLRGARQELRDFASTATLAGAALTAGVTIPILGVAAKLSQLGIDAVEAKNLIDVSFGEMAGAAGEWSNRLSESLGLNKFEMEKQAATLYNMTTSMGIAKQEAFNLSTGVLELAADMASFRNIGMDEALTKIRSGLVGEAEPLKAIGILVDENTVKTAAYKSGLVAMGEELTGTQKVMARWQAILQQTKNDQGDLARTLDSPANQLRIMRSRLAEASTELGVAFIPMIQSATSFLSNMTPKVVELIKAFADLPAPLKIVITGVGALAAGIGPLLGLLGSMAFGLSALPGLMTAIGGATALATGPFGILAFALTGVVIALTSLNISLDQLEQRQKMLSQQGKVKVEFIDENGVVKAKILAKEAEAAAEQARRAKQLWDEASQKVLMPGTTVQLRVPTKDATSDLSALRAEATKLLNDALKPIPPALLQIAKDMQTAGVPIDQIAEKMKQFGVTQAQLVKSLSDVKKGLQEDNTIWGDWTEGGNRATRMVLDHNIALNDFVTETDLASEAVREQLREFGLLERIHFGPPLVDQMHAVSATARNLIVELKQTVQAVPPTTAWENAWSGVKDGLSDVLDKIPDILTAAFTGGGGIMGALKGIGVMIADAFITPMMEQLAKAGKLAVGAGSAMSAALGGAAGGGTGAMIGGMASSLGGAALAASSLGTSLATSAMGAVALGAATMGIGAAAVGVYMLVKHFAGVSKEVKQARAEVKEFEDALLRSLTAEQVAAAGGDRASGIIIKLNEAYGAVGLTAEDVLRDVNQLWDTNHPERARAAMQRINLVLGEHNRLLGEANEEAARLAAEAELAFDWREAAAAAEEYGINVEALGPAFNRGKITDTANELFRVIDGYRRGGFEMGVVTYGMREELGQLVKDAIATGTALPESLRQYIEQLAKSGELVDENGEKIEDISELEFTKPLEEGVEDLNETMRELIELFREIPSEVRTRFVTEYESQGGTRPPIVPGSGATGPGEATGRTGFTLNVDGRTMAEVLVPHLVPVLNAAGIR